MSDLLFGSQALAHLETLREHASAPRFNFESGDMLTGRRLADVKRFEAETLAQTFWSPGQRPQWLPDFLNYVFRQVPYYREFAGASVDLAAIPTVGRTEFHSEIERFVPDNLGLEELTVYTTSGTTGTSLTVPTDPCVSSKVLVLMDRLLSSCGNRLPRGSGQVAVAAVFFQQQTLTYPSLSHYLQGASTLKLNLHPSSWRKDSDRADYLRTFAPAVITGCPYSLSVLAELAPELRPMAVMSSAVALGHGLTKKLEEVFCCPVFDVYSLTESKFIACRTGEQEFDLLSPDLFVEILDESGAVVPDGSRGEITLTGGRNHCLPLLRYRTGDFAALEYRGRQPYLVDFQGRSRIELVDSRGQWISSLDIVHALREFPLVGFSFQQNPQGDYLLRFCGHVEPKRIKDRIKLLTGLVGECEQLESWEGKPQQFVALS